MADGAERCTHYSNRPLLGRLDKGRLALPPVPVDQQSSGEAGEFTASSLRVPLAG
jgi:hypothetical protein